MSSVEVGDAFMHEKDAKREGFVVAESVTTDDLGVLRVNGRPVIGYAGVWLIKPCFT